MLPKYLEFPELFENSPCTSLGSPLPIFYLHLFTAASQTWALNLKYRCGELHCQNNNHNALYWNMTFICTLELQPSCVCGGLKAICIKNEF